MIKAIIFDCFGVITTDSWRAFADSLPPEQVDQARDLNKQLNMGMIEHPEFIEEIRQLTGREPVQVEKLLQNEVVKNEALLDYIRELKQAGYQIGMLSNIASNWIRDTLLTAEEQSLFEEMIFSYEVGMAKPDPRIFMLMCERLRVGPHEAVMVDDVESYCEAARAEGLQAVWFQDLQQLKRELSAILDQA